MEEENVYTAKYNIKEIIKQMRRNVKSYLLYSAFGCLISYILICLELSIKSEVNFTDTFFYIFYTMILYFAFGIFGFWSATRELSRSALSIRFNDDYIELITYKFNLFNDKIKKSTEILTKESIVSVKTSLKKYEDSVIRLNTSNKNITYFSTTTIRSSKRL